MKALEKLKKYSESGKYVFHGSPNGGIEVFKPRQAYNWNEKGEKIPDGKPAVFATEVLDIAIFFALFNHQTMPIKNSIFSFDYKDDGRYFLKASQNKIDYFTNNLVQGWVYVFDKEDFFSRGDKSGEMVSEKRVKPVDVVLVQNDDLEKEVLVRDVL